MKIFTENTILVSAILGFLLLSSLILFNDSETTMAAIPVTFTIIRYSRVGNGDISSNIIRGAGAIN